MNGFYAGDLFSFKFFSELLKMEILKYIDKIRDDFHRTERI
jgi:hypothetical protein